jgi:hypothetical protein
MARLSYQVYLPFSGNIADSSGNGNPTTAVGNVLTDDAHGYPNNAFGATGNGERVLVTNNGSIKFDIAWSVSLGFMVHDNRFESLFDMVDPTTAYGFIMGVGIPHTDAARNCRAVRQLPGNIQQHPADPFGTLKPLTNVYRFRERTFLTF